MTISTLDNKEHKSPDSVDADVRMCDPHNEELMQALRAAGEDTFGKTEDELAARMKRREFDSLIESTRVLITLAVKVAGTQALMHHHCPMCLFRNFDFIGETAAIMAASAKRRPGRIITPPHVRNDDKPVIQLVR